MTNTLTKQCGVHCGTQDGKTAHCRHCHAWGYGEADGCWVGCDSHGDKAFEFSATHEPGSHRLDDLIDAAAAEYDQLTFGPDPVGYYGEDY